jgi:putative membrane protein
MGLANLVPGVSGGTMILVIGLYDEFINSVADVTRLRFTRRNVTFLGLVSGAALVVIATLAGTLSRAVTLHHSAMFSLFIGLTLGGAPLLMRMLAGFNASSVAGLLVGLAIMVTIAVTKDEPPDKSAIRAAVSAGEFVIEPGYTRDVAAGALGMSAMVLPGISGAYMLLVLDRYEPILASVSTAKSYALSLGGRGDPAVFLKVLVPAGIGAVVSLVCLSNLLKWALRRYEKTTLGVLLGVLLGSVVGIWPFDAASQGGDYALGGALALGGFMCTTLLSRIKS